MKNKKRSGFIGFLGAAALAGLTAIPAAVPANVQAAKQETTINQQQQKQQAPVQAPTSTAVTDQLPTHMGGVALGGKNSHFGIPPHIYGMYHVRRGSHKKTNK
jgi:hypothetical protein